MAKTAETLKKISEKLHLPLIYKSSFQKDNRSSVHYYDGPGLEKGLETLSKIKKEFSLPILTDVHYPEQIKSCTEVVDVIQIPAYLCMQTTLVVAAAKTGKVVNIKHGQFLAPENMSKPAQKVVDSGNEKIILTERGYTFGYNDLIVDPRSFYHLHQTGYPVVFDITHSIRKYGIPSADPKGGAREFLPTIARAGVAAGVDGRHRRLFRRQDLGAAQAGRDDQPGQDLGGRLDRPDWRGPAGPGLGGGGALGRRCRHEPV